MVLNQAALLMAALPPRRSVGRRRAVVIVFDRWIATALLVGLCIAVSFPEILDPTLANALYTAQLGLFMLVCDVLFWGQASLATQSLRTRWQVALVAWRVASR